MAYGFGVRLDLKEIQETFEIAQIVGRLESAHQCRGVAHPRVLICLVEVGMITRPTLQHVGRVFSRSLRRFCAGI